MRRHDGAHARANARGPARGDGLHVGVEADTLHTVHIVIAEERAFPSTKTVKRHRHGDRNVDAHHAHLYLVGERTRRIAVSGEEANTVAEFVIIHQVQCFLKAWDAQHPKHRAKNLFAINAHFRGHVIEQAGRDKEALALRQRVPRVFIDEECCSFFDAQFDITGDLVAVYARNQWAHFRARLRAIGDLEARDALFHAREQGLGGAIADRNGHRDRHAALARGTEGRARERVGRLVHVRIRHHDHVVLRPAQRLYALAGRGAAAVDILSNRGGTDKADSRNAGMVEDCIHYALVAVHHVKYSIRQPGFFE